MRMVTGDRGKEEKMITNVFFLDIPRSPVICSSRIGGG